MTCYKLNIYKDDRDSWTETSLGPFININPIYIVIPDANKDEFITTIYNIIAEYIIKIDKRCNGRYDDDTEFNLDFRVIIDIYDEKKVEVKGDINSIVEFLENNPKSIYQEFSDDKYWGRYYIEFSETTNKGGEYSIKELNKYIKKMFDYVDW